MDINIAEMLSGNELQKALLRKPEYDEYIRYKSITERLLQLSNLYSIYIPSQMSKEIYNKLYLALIHSLAKKNTKEFIIQQNENHKAILQREHNGIIGGSDSFTIIGVSGIGKSSAIGKSIALISENEIIKLSETKIIPFVTVQCPFDASVKGMLFEVLRKVDEVLDSNYYKNAVRTRATTDMLIGCVSQVALNHIGMIIVDEIQNVCKSKHGRNLVGMLTQLINNSGVSICMVGTPECSSFFEREIQLARRALGLHYEPLKFDEYFADFCKTVFSYQYVRKTTEISAGIIEWLYEHSGGITSVVVSLIHDAQEMAILDGSEILNIDTLKMAYTKRLSMMHEYIHISKKSSEKPKKNTVIFKETNNIDEKAFSDYSTKSKKENINVIELLKGKITVEEIVL